MLPVAMYSLFLFFLMQSTSVEIAFIFGRLSVACATFVSVTFFYFVAIFLDIWKKYGTFVKWGFIIFSFFFLATIFPIDWVVKTVGPVSIYKYFPQPGLLFHIFLFIWTIYFVVPIFFLFFYHKKADKIKKAQIRYLILGITLGNIGGLGNWMLVYGIPVSPPYIVLSFLVFSLGYAILKHHLFSIKMFIVELLTFAIWFVLLVKIIATKQAGGLIFFDVIIFLSIVLIGFFLIRTGVRESRQREMLAELNTELDYLNHNLQKKVDEQTKEIHTAYEVEREARLQLEKLNEAKNEFVLASQHNLRTPLTIVKGYIEGIDISLKEGKEVNIQEYVDKTTGVIDTMSDLINGLIDVTELKVGREGFSKKG